MMLWLIDAFIIVLIIVVRQTLLMLIMVKGKSMMPTLRNGDFLLVWRPARKRIRRGDIVICHYPNRFSKHFHMKTNFVKRVIGLPGEILTIQSGQVYINDEAIAEPYLDPTFASARGNRPAKRVGRHRYYVMGDHRNCSNDSRAVGTIYATEIVGRVIRIIHMPAWFGRLIEQGEKQRRLLKHKNKGIQRDAKTPPTP